MDKYQEFIEAGKLNKKELRTLVIKIYGQETWEKARDFTFTKHYFPKNDNCDENYYEYALQINWIEDVRSDLGVEARFQIWIGKDRDEKAKAFGNVFLGKVKKKEIKKTEDKKWSELNEREKEMKINDWNFWLKVAEIIGEK